MGKSSEGSKIDPRELSKSKTTTMAPKFDNLVEHILKNILGIRTGHSIRKVLESKEVYNYDSFCTMNPTVVR